MAVAVSGNKIEGVDNCCQNSTFGELVGCRKRGASPFAVLPNTSGRNVLGFNRFIFRILKVSTFIRLHHSSQPISYQTRIASHRRAYLCPPREPDVCAGAELPRMEPAAVKDVQQA